MRDMKKILIALFLLISLSACGEAESYEVAVRQGCDFTDTLDRIREFCPDIEVVEMAESPSDYSSYYASIDLIRMGDTLGYGMLKSSPIEYINLCAVSYDSYPMSTDLSGVKAAVVGDINCSDYITVPGDCSLTPYESPELAIEDLNEGYVDVILCLSTQADNFYELNSGLRIEDVMDSTIYEYAVISNNGELIDYLG